MTRASCLPLKKGPFNFSTNRVFTLLENDGSESSVTLQHFGQSTSEPSLTREKSAGRREQVRYLPFRLFRINFSRVQSYYKRRSIEYFSFKANNCNWFYTWEYSPWIRIHIFSLVMEYIFRRWKFFMNHCESTRACNFSLMKLLWLLFSNCFLSKWIVIIIMFWSICSLKISSSFLLVFSNLFITRNFWASVGRFKAFSSLWAKKSSDHYTLLCFDHVCTFPHVGVNLYVRVVAKTRLTIDSVTFSSLFGVLFWPC